MLESKRENNDINDIDIKKNTAGTVGFDPKTGRVFYIEEPTKEVDVEDLSDADLDWLTNEIEKNTAKLNKIIDAAKKGDFSGLGDL